MKLAIFLVAMLACSHAYPVPDDSPETAEKDSDERDEVADGVVEVPLPEEGAELGDVVNKMAVNEEVEARFGDFKDNCFPRPSGGCKCNREAEDGSTVVQEFPREQVNECKVPLTEQEDGMVELPVPEESGVGDVLGKAIVGAEIKAKYGDFKDGCFPRPSGGCTCNAEGAGGEETSETFDTDAECKVELQQLAETEGEEGNSRVKRVISREQAKANYDKVVQELNEKFKGLKEGCYPRPKGCLCVIGKDKNGRDITERRRKEKDCKCQEGETGPECPAGGA